MQNLYRNFRLQLELASTDFIRFLHDKIAWDSRLIAIVGSRGVGKTTLLLQHIKSTKSLKMYSISLPMTSISPIIVFSI